MVKSLERPRLFSRVPKTPKRVPCLKVRCSAKTVHRSKRPTPPKALWATAVAAPVTWSATRPIVQDFEFSFIDFDSVDEELAVYDTDAADTASNKNSVQSILDNILRTKIEELEWFTTHVSKVYGL